MKILTLIDKFIEKVQIVVSITIFVTIVILGSMQVFFRYFLNSSLPWSEELMRFLFIWLVFIGSSITVRLDRHVAIDLLAMKLKPKMQTVMFIITRLVCVAFLVLMLPASLELFQKASTSRASILPVTFQFVYASFVVGTIMMILSYASSIPKFARKISKGERG